MPCGCCRCVGALQMIGLESIWSSHLSFMAKCAFWMLGGLTIYGFISFLVITIMSVMQVFVSLRHNSDPP